MFYICRDISVWIVFGTQIFMMMSLSYFLQQFEERKLDWNTIYISGMACYCCVTSPYNPKNNANRILFLSLLLGSIVFYTAYCAFLMADHTFYLHQIGTIEEIVAQNYSLAGDKMAFLKLRRQTEVRLSNASKHTRYFNENYFHLQIYSATQIQNFKLCQSLDLCFETLQSNVQQAIALSHEQVESFQRESASKMFCFGRTDVVAYEYAPRFIVQKSFPYLKKFNAFISAARNSGWISKWLKENQRKKFFNIKSPPKDFVSKLADWFGILVMYFIIVPGVLFVFIAERIIHNRVQKYKKPIKFWAIAELLIDPYRHFLNNDLRY